MTAPPGVPPRGVRLRLTRTRILVFTVALIAPIVAVRDGVFGSGVTWWTLYTIALSSAIASGGLLWLFARAKRRAQHRSGGTA